MSKVILITGATSGIGYESARYFASEGYNVIIASRSKDKCEQAINNIKNEFPFSKVSYYLLDLTDSKSIYKFYLSLKHVKIDYLVNNAGVFLPPYTLTDEGQELQMHANYLGHFFLTYLLIDNISDDGKIINVSSLAHKMDKARIHFEDISFSYNYDKWEAYQQSKLACALFGVELDRRLKLKNSQIKSIIVHPGVSLTNLSRHLVPSFLSPLTSVVGKLISASSQYEGSQCIRYAIENDTLQGGEYIGPLEHKERKGKVGIASLSDQALDQEISRRLWEYSEYIFDIDFL